LVGVGVRVVVLVGVTVLVGVGDPVVVGVGDLVAVVVGVDVLVCVFVGVGVGVKSLNLPIILISPLSKLATYVIEDNPDVRVGVGVV
jgi:hypothetical protein